MHPLLQKFLNGEFGLCKTFWGSFVGGIFISALLTTLLGAKLTSAVMFFYSIAAYVGTWRAADKYEGEKIWSTSARVVVILSAFGLITSILSSF